MFYEFYFSIFLSDFQRSQGEQMYNVSQLYFLCYSLNSNNSIYLSFIIFILQKMFDEAVDPEQMHKKQTKLFEQKRKYKNLQTDKKTYIDESVKVIKKQKTAIEKMKKENEALKDLISKMNKEGNASTKSFTNNQASQQVIEEINMAIQNQKETQKSIDIHIKNFQDKITEKRKNCMGMNSGAENQNNLQKQIKILENRLDKANQKFNETTANNKQLKNLIDSFRRERVIFDNLYKKLQKQLHEKRKKMADIIEKANNAYEERDKAHNQIQTLKIQAKKQASQFEKQIKDMSYLMEKIKLSSYGKKNGKLNESTTGNYFYQTDALMGNTQTRMSKQTKKNSVQVQKIQKYRQDFAKIQAATEIQNFEELLRIFSENQEKNFQMFKFVNLQSNQIEQLQAEVFQLTRELNNANYNPDGDQNKDNYVYELEKNLMILKNQLETTKKEYQRNQCQIRPLTVHIERVFETIECDRQLVKQLAGNKAISQNNLFIFLAIIEHKAIQIVNTFKQLSNPGIFAQQAKPANIQTGMLTFDDFEDNQQYNKILTAEELRQKAKDFIEREQNQKQKKKQLRGKKK